MPLGVNLGLFCRAKRMEERTGRVVRLARRVLRGLYGNQHPVYTEVRAKGKFWGRPWIVKKTLPNVQNKRLWSEIMNRFIRFRVTTRVIKTIDKYGGLDNYLMKTPLDKLNSKVGMYWRFQLLETLKARLAAYKGDPNFARGFAAAAIGDTTLATSATAAAKGAGR